MKINRLTLETLQALAATPVAVGILAAGADMAKPKGPAASSTARE